LDLVAELAKNHSYGDTFKKHAGGAKLLEWLIKHVGLKMSTFWCEYKFVQENTS